MKAILILALFCSSAFADWTTFSKPNGDFEIKPQAIPGTLTTVITGDIHLTNLVITVSSGTPVVTVQDKQGTPVPLLAGITTVTGTTYFLPSGIEYYCPGGISVSATGGGTAYIYLSFK